uniref:L1 transposable element RRM domain-containing protein n=1 Tax=Knipowitschia caucasica TaxID=637954 RepID=A0AAV2JM17_KNICA
MIKSDTTELKNSVSAIKTRLTEAESRISDVEDTVANLAKNNEKLTKAVAQLYERVDDQENRARRKNIRLVGLKEGKEAGMPLANYVQKILSDGLELNGGEYEIERCHRSLAPRPDPDKPPRIILVRFLKYIAREKVLAAAKKKKGIQWDGCRLSLFEDMTKERSARRKVFSPLMKMLWQHQVKHTLAHPAILRFTWRGQRLSFTDGHTEVHMERTAAELY